MPFEHRADVRELLIPKRLRARPHSLGVLPHVVGQIFQIDLGACRHGACPLNRVFEFAYVPGPEVPREGVDRAVAVAGDRTPKPGGRLREQVAEQAPEFVRPLPQRWDAQFDDARLAVTLMRTARDRGATCLNYCALTGLIKSGGRVCGGLLRDAESNEEFAVRARAVINATGGAQVD